MFTADEARTLAELSKDKVDPYYQAMFSMIEEEIKKRALKGMDTLEMFVEFDYPNESENIHLRKMITNELTKLGYQHVAFFLRRDLRESTRILKCKW